MQLPLTLAFGLALVGEVTLYCQMVTSSPGRLSTSQVLTRTTWYPLLVCTTLHDIV
jgi:hypothetical protein